MKNSKRSLTLIMVLKIHFVVGSQKKSLGYTLFLDKPKSKCYVFYCVNRLWLELFEDKKIH